MRPGEASFIAPWPSTPEILGLPPQASTTNLSIVVDSFDRPGDWRKPPTENKEVTPSEIWHTHCISSMA